MSSLLISATVLVTSIAGSGVIKTLVGSSPVSPAPVSPSSEMSEIVESRFSLVPSPSKSVITSASTTAEFNSSGVISALDGTVYDVV